MIEKNQLKMKRKDKINFISFYLVYLFSFINIPIYSIGNRVDPFIFGIPFSLFWIIA